MGVLEGFDLSYDEVGVVGLLGPNGAGKTTILRLLATVAWPVAGTMSLLGLDPNVVADLREIRRRLGYLPQGSSLLKGVTVSAYLRYVAWLKCVPRHRIPAAVAEVAEMMDIAGLMSRRTTQLSGGQRRRVEIAQALLALARLLLLDEPTAGLDPDQRVEFRAVVRGLAADATVVVATHLVEDVVAMCNRVVVVDGGRILFDGSPADLETVGDAEPGMSRAEAGYRSVIRGSAAR